MERSYNSCVRACVCVCVCACAPGSQLLLGRFKPDRSHFLCFFFLYDGGSKIRFLMGPMRFCFISNFRFSQNLFLLFSNDRIEIFKSDGYHSKEK